MTVTQLSKKLDDILKDIPDKSFDKFCIMEDMGGITRENCLIHPENEVSEDIAKKVISAAEKRAEGYPLQYILGQWEFFGRQFKVGEGVLIPRPDTEVLVEEVLKRLSKSEKHSIIDLCSGSGCIAVTLAKELEGSDVYAVELSGDAFPYLAENVKRNGANVKLLRGDVMNGAIMENFRDPEEPDEYINIDCIVSNPPYLTEREMAELQKEVTFEPHKALYGGVDGLQFYRVIARLWSEVLAADGLMIFEIGSEQAEDVKNILASCGFGNILTANDATGAVRVIGGYKFESE